MAGEWIGEINADEQREFFGGNRDVLHHDCCGGYVSIRICQVSMNCILKTDVCM